MTDGRKPAHYDPGWLDVGVYLQDLKRTTGRGWSVCIAATGELSERTFLVFSVCEWRAGAPILRDDLALVADCWPRSNTRNVATTVYQLLHSFDRRLAEREEKSVAQASF